MEGHRMHRELRVNEEAAAEIRGVVDRYRNRDSVCPRSRHVQQTQTLALHGQSRFVDLGERAIGLGHAGDLCRREGATEGTSASSTAERCTGAA